MAKKESPTKDKQILAFKKGEKVEFPVPRNHRYAKFQPLKKIKSLEDIGAFVTLWSSRAARLGQPIPRAEAILPAVRRQIKNVLVLSANDFVVPKGTTVILNSPLNQLDFDKVIIKGDLVSRGDLVVKCQELA